MKPRTLKSLDAQLTRFLEEIIELIGRSERRHWARPGQIVNVPTDQIHFSQHFFVL